MNNIFENAYFGKAYKTRDGRKAIYNEYTKSLIGEWRHFLMVEKADSVLFSYDNEGIYECGDGCKEISNADIVSEWQEPIND